MLTHRIKRACLESGGDRALAGFFLLASVISCLLPCKSLFQKGGRGKTKVYYVPVSFQLPYLVDGKNKITQSNAILRYIARKHNMCEWASAGVRETRPRVGHPQGDLLLSDLQVGTLKKRR